MGQKDTFVDFEQGLNVCIRQIRTALLNLHPRCPRFVETVPRRGYRFIAQAAQVARPAPVDSLAVLPFDNSSGDPDLENDPSRRFGQVDDSPRPR